MVKSLLAVACCIALASCGMKQKPAAAPATAPPEATSGAPLPGDPRAQIEELDRQIDASLVELKLDEPTPDMVAGAPAIPMGALPSSQDPKCRPAPTDTCKTSCTLSDSICGNADKICRLAQDMTGDSWAQNKCAKANKTCEASRAKCCGCQ